MNITQTIGTLRVNTQNRALEVTVKYQDGRLSITGRHGRGSFGQVIMSFKEYDKRGHVGLNDICPKNGFSHESIRELFDIWDRWHLNDMQAGTPGQMEHLRKLEFLGHPGSHYTWAKSELIKAGLEPCPKTGHSYGSAWLTEEVPLEVLERLQAIMENGK